VVTADATLHLPGKDGTWVVWTIERVSIGIEIREKHATREQLTIIPSAVISSLMLLDIIPMLPSAQTVVHTDDGVWTQWSAEQATDGVWLLQEGRDTPEQTKQRTFLPAAVVATLLLVWSEAFDN
jgi:hypothetical protein